MKKSKYVALVVAAFALAVFALVGCSSGSGSAASSAAASSAAASSAAASADASASADAAAPASASAAAASADAATTGTKLVVGFDAEYPPYGYMGADGQYTGFDLDLAQAVCAANGWEYEAKPIDWDAKDAELSSGSINCIWNGFTMEGREGQYTFSEPYMLNEQVIVVKADSDVKKLADLADKIVITQTGSAAAEVLGEEGDQAALAKTFKTLETIADYNNAFMQLDSGIDDAVACDLSIAQYQMAQNPDKYVMLEEPLSSEHYAVGFKLGDEEMAKTVSDTLKSLDADGTVKTLCEKYANEGMDYSNWILK